MMVMILASVSWLWAQVSFNFTTQAISLLLLALLLDYVKRRKRCSRYPPGPTPLPFIGNLLELDLRYPPNSFQRIREKFGNVFSLQAGWNNIVVLNGFKVIKEALGKKAEDFSDRPSLPLLCMIGHKRNAAGLLLANYSNNWKQQRKFCMSVLKHFGMGKKTLEKRIREEAGYLCSELRSKRGSPFNPEYIMFNVVTNIICILTFGDRFEYDDEKFLKLIHLAENLMKAMARAIPQFFSAGSWLAYIPGPHHKVLRLFKDFCGMISEIVSEHKKTRDPTLARDVIDEYLEEIEKDKGNPETSFNEQNLINVICDLFLAGAETTSNTLLWGLFYMVLHPEIQQKVQEEIDNVIGRARPPMMEDQQKLPYTNAVIHEIQRAADIAPIALPRATYRDTEVDNFYIPKGTVILTMLTTVLKDETMWEKPHQFYPEHFLDANGQFVKHEAFLPFSLGRHVCAGEQLAKMELFIFFISLLQHFTLCIPENSPTPKEDRVFAITIPAPTLQICAIPR